MAKGTLHNIPLNAPAPCADVPAPIPRALTALLLTAASSSTRKWLTAIDRIWCAAPTHEVKDVENDGKPGENAARQLAG